MANESMGAARKAKNDEFYTQFPDIEKEMNAYLEYNEDVFKDKTLLLPCDDPEWSNFTKYFAQNFERLGLKKLISTSYAPNSKPKELNLQPTLFELESPKFDEIKSFQNGKIFTLEHDTNKDRVINVEDLEWSYLAGDGDFRSSEITRLRDEADIIITNPPFSLFREFLSWILEANKNFSVIGNKNAITYREVFPIIQENRMWVGATPMSIDLLFNVPESIASEFLLKGREGSSYKRVGNQVLGRASAIWFTNLDHGKRHQPLPLMTEAENVKFSKHSEVKGIGYFKYDNYDALEVPFTDAIPSDVQGILGVPISFLGKYSPEQFEIVGLSRYTQTMGMSKEFVDAYYASGQKGQISEGHPDLCYYDNDGQPVVPYMRILIRHKRGK